jgi:hypothetical protein
MDKKDYIKIIEIVKQKGFIPKTELIKYIIDKFKISEVTAVRKIDYLIQQKKLIKINKSEYSEYNIKEDDKRVVYIGLKLNKEAINYVNKKLSEFNKEKSPENKKLILRDISLYKENIVYTNNIDDLINILKNNNIDKELNYKIIGIIYDLVIKKKNILKEESKEKLLDILKKILKENPKYDRNYSNLKSFIISILANYNDKEFLIQLEKDLLNENDEYIENTYYMRSLAECIDNYKEELYNLQKKFNTKKMNKKVDQLLKIRSKANEYLGLIDKFGETI